MSSLHVDGHQHVVLTYQLLRTPDEANYIVIYIYYIYLCVHMSRVYISGHYHVKSYVSFEKPSVNCIISYCPKGTCPVHNVAFFPQAAFFSERI